MDNNKTIFSSVTLICASLIIICAMYIFKKQPLPASLTADKFTHCLQIIMSESRQSGKVIDANQAKEICLNVDKSNIVKK